MSTRSYYHSVTGNIKNMSFFMNTEPYLQFMLHHNYVRSIPMLE